MGKEKAQCMITIFSFCFILLSSLTTSAMERQEDATHIALLDGKQAGCFYCNIVHTGTVCDPTSGEYLGSVIGGCEGNVIVLEWQQKNTAYDASPGTCITFLKKHMAKELDSFQVVELAAAARKRMHARRKEVPLWFFARKQPQGHVVLESALVEEIKDGE